MQALTCLMHRLLALTALGVASALIAGCGSAPKSGPAAPLPRPAVAGTVPPDPVRLPDAEPRVEPIRQGGPNKPYEVLGRAYSPETRDLPMREKGLASWYGKPFHGRRTASGEVFNMHAMTAAHKTMPLPSYARVRNPGNGREIVVRINDRGPFHAGRVIDLSYAAAVKLGTQAGVARVEVERITYEDIRTGAWQRGNVPVSPSPPGDTAQAQANAAQAVRAATARLGEPGAALPVLQSTAAAPAEPWPGEPPTSPSAAPQALPNAQQALTTAQPALNAAQHALPAAQPALPATATATATATASPAAEPPPAPVADGKPEQARTSAARGWWVQLGAFRDRGGAESFQQRVAGELDWLSPLLAVIRDAPLYRLQAGPYASRDEAQSSAQRVRERLQLVPLLIERR